MQVLPLLVPGRQVGTTCTCVLLQSKLTEPRHKKSIIAFEESNQHVGILDIFLQKLAKKDNVLLEQTAQALIRLRRYLGMHPQQCVQFVAFSLTLLSRNTGDVLSHDTKNGTCKNK